MGLRKIKNPGEQQSFGVLDIVLTIYLYITHRTLQGLPQGHSLQSP